MPTVRAYLISAFCGRRAAIHGLPTRRFSPAKRGARSSKSTPRILRLMRLLSRKAPRAAEPRTGKLKLVLHVGPYKTGTTSLQKALLKQHGSEDPQAIWYPLPEDFGPGHASKVWKMLGQRGNSPSPAIGLSVEHAKKTLACQCLILSSEVFAGTFPNRVQPLVEQTADTDMHIVITLS